MEALDTFIGSMLTLERWPFWAAVLVFTIVGQFTSKNLFTRERAYATYVLPRGAKTPWEKHFWWWGRETLVIHPLLAGFVLGAVWQDPEGAGWKLIGSQMYFAAAGAVSAPLWAIVKAVAKKRGFALALPGESSNPPPPAND
jgi:hypothetical protein